MILIGFIAITFSTSSCKCRVDRTKYHIQIPLPPKIDPSVTMMTVEEKPDVTYSDIGGCKEQIEKMREVSIPSSHTSPAGSRHKPLPHCTKAGCQNSFEMAS